MKLSKNIIKALVLTLILIVILFIIEVSNVFFGADKVFLGCLGLTPLILYWCVKTDYRKR